MLRKSAILLLMCGLGSSLYLVHLYHRTIDLDHDQPIRFSVRPGESIRQVATRLESNHFIGWADGFILLAKFHKVDRHLKSGDFIFRSHFKPNDILRTLIKAPPSEGVRITFPEGLNRWQIADRLAQDGWNRKLVLRQIQQRQLEGKLFPDTYSVTRTMTETEVLDVMHRRFNAVWAKILSTSSQRPKLSEHELITLASLIEKETVKPEEAPIIARVFLNRLRKDMKLQSDPTYVYTKERYGKKPTKADRLTKDNPYNTDVIKGLPPGPIANPGRIALSAALNPSSLPKASSWLYFVAKRDGTGEHYFSRTYKEHRKAIKRYLK